MPTSSSSNPPPQGHFTPSSSSVSPSSLNASANYSATAAEGMLAWGVSQVWPLSAYYNGSGGGSSSSTGYSTGLPSYLAEKDSRAEASRHDDYRNIPTSHDHLSPEHWDVDRQRNFLNFWGTTMPPINAANVASYGGGAESHLMERRDSSSAGFFARVFGVGVDDDGATVSSGVDNGGGFRQIPITGAHAHAANYTSGGHTPANTIGGLSSAAVYRATTESNGNNASEENSALSSSPSPSAPRSVGGFLFATKPYDLPQDPTLLKSFRETECAPQLSSYERCLSEEGVIGGGVGRSTSTDTSSSSFFGPKTAAVIAFSSSANAKRVEACQAAWDRFSSCKNTLTGLNSTNL